MHMRTANYLPSGLAEKGHDSELPASYHRGKAMIDIGQAEKKLKGSEQNVTESTPQVIDFFILLILTIYYSAAWGSDALVCLGT